MIRKPEPPPSSSPANIEHHGQGGSRKWSDKAAVSLGCIARSFCRGHHKGPVNHGCTKEQGRFLASTPLHSPLALLGLLASSVFCLEPRRAISTCSQAASPRMFGTTAAGCSCFLRLQPSACDDLSRIVSRHCRRAPWRSPACPSAVVEQQTTPIEAFPRLIARSSLALSSA